jgi:hypothetical protein
VLRLHSAAEIQSIIEVKRIGVAPIVTSCADFGRIWDGKLSPGERFFDVTSASGEDALDSMKVDENGHVYGFESCRDLDLVARKKTSRHYRLPEHLRENRK